MVGILPNPRAADHRTSRWDPTAGYLESTVLATIHMWMLKHDKVQVVGQIVRNFLAPDLYQAMCELSSSVGQDKPPGHRDTAGSLASELYATELCDMIAELTSQSKLPKIVVSSFCLGYIPAPVPKTSDDMTVTARLESMEVGLKKVTEALSKLTAEQSKRQEFISSNNSQNHLKVPSAPPASPVSWVAAAAVGVGAGGRSQGQGENHVTGRPRLDSIGNPQKRARQEEAVQLSQPHDH